MKNPKPITTNSHLTQQQLLRYHAGELEAAAMHRAEQHLLDCELCSDALEGLEQLDPRQAQAAMADVHQRLAARIKDSQSRPVYWQWAVAASVLLLVTAALFLLQDTVNLSDQPISQQEAPSKTVRPETIDPNPAITSQSTLPEQSVESPSANNKETLIAMEEKPAAHPLTQEVQELKDAARDEPTDVSLSEPVLADAYHAPLQDAPLAKAPARATLSRRQAKPDSLPAVTTIASAPTLAQGKSVEVEYLDRSTQIRLRGASSQSIEGIQGKVVDAATNEPLPGVSVRIKGTQIGTVTDSNGEYILPQPNSEATLQISFIGYTDKLMPVDENTTQLIAKLEEDVASLSEVVVTGYGTEKGTEAAAPTAAKPAEGMRTFRKWVKEALRYPEAARQAKVEGAVVVSFNVEPNGSLTGFKVLKPLGYGLDEEAIRLVQEGPKWQPATINGEAVGQKTRVRISFKLPKDQ